jgi:SAM-dependent methyltransferase
MGWQQRYLAHYYSPERGFVNGTSEFHSLCASVCPRGGSLLEIGAGPSNPTSRHLATLGTLHGLDPDPDVEHNDALASAKVLTGDRFPYDDATFDVCISNYVCEHVADPKGHLEEVRRVLKPGGAYVFRTPNLYHYVSGVAALTPHWFHELVANPLRNMKRDSHAPYPTFHRMNSRKRIMQLAQEVGMEVEQIKLVEKEPSYGMSFRVLFFTFLAYERVVNATEKLADLRANLFVVCRRAK